MTGIYTNGRSDGIKTETMKMFAASAVAHAIGGAAIIVLLSGCAMPSAESGKAAQGGSVTSGPPITVTVNIGTGGTVSTSSTSVPTAAPAASSTGGVEQEGNADGKVDLKVPAGAGGLSLTPPETPVAPTPEAPKPEPKPGE